MSHRGRGGVGVNIRVKNSSSVVLKNITFLNNSLVKEYDTASSLWVHFDSNSSYQILHLSSCTFHGNRVGRNMVMFYVAGFPLYMLIDNCVFKNNSDHSVSLIELGIHSQSVFNVVHSNFIINKHSALIYAQICSANFTTLMNRINITNNSAFFLQKKGGFIFFEMHDAANCSVNMTALYCAKNHFVSTINGGGIYISGTFHSSFKCFILDSNFNGNTGFATGTVIYNSLASVTVEISSYVVFIDKCVFTNNAGKSIVYVAMEYYVIPAFLILNGDFINNTGIPLELLNVILVGKGNTTIQNNCAKTGAALHLSNSYILLNYSSFQFNLINNRANLYGGGIYLDFSSSKLDHSQCHWLLFAQNNFCQKYTHKLNDCSTHICTSTFCSVLSKTEHSVTSVKLINNTALLSGTALFYKNVDVFKSSSSSDTNMSNPSSIFYIPGNFNIIPGAMEPLVLATEPKMLMLHDPATCNDDITTCSITDIMLGQEIKAPATILGYNEKQAQATMFFLTCVKNCDHYAVSNESLVLVRDTLNGITIVGAQVQKHVSLLLQLDSGVISLTLKVEIVPCNMGYAYVKTYKQCKCYSSPENIVICKQNMTTIKKDYWFGSVEGRTSVSQCPNKYCNFTRKDVSPGRFLLPSTYDDQCGLHRNRTSLW